MVKGRVCSYSNGWTLDQLNALMSDLKAQRKLVCNSNSNSNSNSNGGDGDAAVEAEAKAKSKDADASL